MNTVTHTNGQSNSCRCLPVSLWLGDQDAPELLKSKGSREKTRNKCEKVHGCMRAFGNNNERSQCSGAERKGRRADADRVKHRLSVCNVPKPRIELLPFLKPLPEADGRQQDSKRRGQTEMVETCKDCPECQTIKRGHQNNDTLQDANKC